MAYYIPQLKLCGKILGINAIEVYPLPSLQSLHTFSLPSNAEKIIKVTDPNQLTDIDYSIPFVVIGEGSNTLFLDDFVGQVIQIANIGIGISEDEHMYHIKAAAGENWHQLVCYTLNKGIAGFENLALIPGLCGAAPVQNIGAYGVELSDFLVSVEGFDIITGQFNTLTAEQCQLSYRDSIFKHALKQRFIITAIHLAVRKNWQPNCHYGPLQHLQEPTAQQIYDLVVQTRQTKLPDPKQVANAGSFFKNPFITAEHFVRLKTQFPDLVAFPAVDKQVKVAAGWLIDRAGLKGEKIAGIEVNPQQALVLLNHGGSGGQDVLKMIERIQHEVHTLFDIKLQHEVRLIGSQGEIIIEVNHENSTR
ncbi:UDP-N-acetylenolpyruvoylglucosamine reductase [Pseudoalteromonas ulvae]|uniref:UDP-N-acetylenolpyruvoylglucosamine reductase n=1 Tax=Pseudoalteromonas ulvae TaxID=107327 RepID=A0A2C9ZZA9_PSEDV|nr:UDP-N-acetylenolpyruvoylglucosamine reductase [Pseudoalteromonas ulvae]